MLLPFHHFRIVLTAMLILCTRAPFALAEDTAPPAKDKNAQVWIVNTRCAPLCGDLEAGKTRIRYRLRRGKCTWQPADAEAFFQSSPTPRPTIYVIHGNRISASEAIPFAWPIYRRLKCQSSGRPFRLVIWSWPSERICRRHRPDAQTKARYSDAQSYYLADSLRRLDPATPVCMVGYSFGARIITGGLHLLACGRLIGRQLPELEGEAESAPRSGPLHAVLVAAAVDSHWLARGQRNGLALSQATSMWITRNGCDPVLRWYPRMYGRRGPEALGYVGPTCSGDDEKIEVMDVSCSVGRNHRWECYLYASGLLSRLPELVFSQ